MERHFLHVFFAGADRQAQSAHAQCGDGDQEAEVVNAVDCRLAQAVFGPWCEVTQVAVDNVEYAALYEQYLDEDNELGKAALAKYVVHRRTILEMLEAALKVQESGAYAREDFVHSLIYPMRANSEEVEFSRQNLWVVDERLAYHTHLASDLPLAKLKVVNAKGGDEPDLVVFNTPRAFTETKSPYQSVVLVEF